jgi:hypothetical protein
MIKEESGVRGMDSVVKVLAFEFMGRAGQEFSNLQVSNTLSVALRNASWAFTLSFYEDI